ncbi:MAG: LCP family protein, partial [Candidatus Melainabacteria bacterium]|nr:LCP family protein [Candidatus Melainabacteria bacterium]
LRPTLLPPFLRLGSLHEPTTILFLGTDVVYTKRKHQAKADLAVFTGRSDTIVVARLDPFRNTVCLLSVPRDTQVHIPGYGSQKINAANAIGGPLMARDVVSSFLGVPLDHYVVLNVHGLVELVDELGGVTVQIPKRMRYMDWTAKLKIDLAPGWHTLTGNQSMGFVRFRHDALGDIGRIQRQELFLRAVLDKALRPESWAHIAELMRIGREYVATDLSEGQMLSILTFVRAVPRENQSLVMLPGKFSGTGDWLVGPAEVREIVAKLMGANWAPVTKMDVRIAIENASSNPQLGLRLSKLLRAKGYEVIAVKSLKIESSHRKQTTIIAQRANPDDAFMVKADLGYQGEVVNASVGDIESTVTIVAGDDLEPLVSEHKTNTNL